MNGFDILLALVIVVFCGLGIYQRLIRQAMSLGVFYLATIGAGLTYRLLATLTQVIGGLTPPGHFVAFWVMFAVFAIALEVMLRKGFEDVQLPKLGFLDNLLGLLPGALCGLIIASLLLTSIGYMSSQSWGGLEGLRILLARGYHNAALRPLLGQFLEAYLTTHVLWFPRIPPILAYALP